MVQSGNTLPQVTQGGSVSGTLHIVTSDGAGPYKAMVDTTGTGAGPWTAMDFMTQVPGTKGNIQKTEKRAWARALQSVGLMKRATNINEDYPFKVAMPAGASCSGTVAGQSNVCMVKLVNPSNAGVSPSAYSLINTFCEYKFLISSSHSVDVSLSRWFSQLPPRLRGSSAYKSYLMCIKVK